MAGTTDSAAVATSGGQQQDPNQYTVWTLSQRRLLTVLLGYLALASSLTANIYFPLLDMLADRYGVSIQAINLTVTVYIIVQGITPSFWSPLSDTWGRRPVYLSTFAIFTLASLGLSIADRNYAALLVLRAFQSAGASGIVSLAYASVADVVVHADRGAFLAPLLTITNTGPCVGPVVGGALVLGSGDPRWCFRALLIAFVMPETARSVVGNGAVPARGMWRTWWDVLSRNQLVRRLHSMVRRKRGEDAEAGEKGGGGTSPDTTVVGPEAVVPASNVGKTGRGESRWPNLWPSIRIVFYADTFLVLWLAGSPSALWFCVQTSLSPIFSERYGFNALEVGLCFLAGGFGVIAAGFVAGRLMDANYRHVARQEGFQIDRVRGDDMTNFPIERARSRGTVPIVLVSLGLIVGYGWAVEKRVHPAVPLVLQAFIGCRCTTLHQTYGALIVDIFPQRTGAAAASKNIMRCTLAGILVAILDPMVSALGYGWVFTILGLFDAVTCIAATVALNRWARRWRREREVGSVGSGSAAESG